jgi:hypothetical protein
MIYIHGKNIFKIEGNLMHWKLRNEGGEGHTVDEISN